MNIPYGYIYLIIDHLHNMKYVGQKVGLPDDTPSYYGSGTVITNIIKKRKHHLQKIVLGICYSQEELDEAETECIYFFRTYGSDGEHRDKIYGYNLRKEGGRGFCCSDKATRKQKYGNTAWNKGIPMSETAKQKSSESHKKYYNTREGKIHRDKFIKEVINDPEVRKKISKTMRKNWQNQTYRRNQISKIHNKKNSEIRRNAMQKHMREYPMTGKNNGMCRKDIEDKIPEIIILKQGGLSYKTIANLFNCSTAPIVRICKQYYQPQSKP